MMALVIAAEAAAVRHHQPNNKMKTKSQSTIEYAVLIAVAVVVIIGMGLYIRRSVQANLKMTEMRINGVDWKFGKVTGGGGGGGDDGGEPPQPPPAQ